MIKPFRTLGILVALPFLLAACAPAVSGESADSEPWFSPPGGQTEWSTQIHGVQVDYNVVSADSPEGQHLAQTGGTYLWSTGSSECGFYFPAKFFEPPAAGQRAEYERLVTSIASNVGRCLYPQVADPASEEFGENQWPFGEAWGALYVERCGPVLHPLGWRNQDSDCQPPAPDEVVL